MFDINRVRSVKPKAVFADPGDAGFPVAFIQEWDGPRLRTEMRNDGGRPVRIREVVLAEIEHEMPGNTKIYGEGFTHLSATAGTIAKPVDLGSYTDRDHYKLPVPEGAATVYGMLLLSPPGGEHVLLGFSTCLRFTGKFHLRPESLQIVLECEGLEIAPGESWQLEDFVCLIGADRTGVLNDFAGYLAERHRAKSLPVVPPTGWCSWYCFGSKVTAEDVRSNLDYISGHVPELRYVQIDDGYQAAIGDWLETGSAFGGGIREVIQEIRGRGFEPAIWVAPFVAQEDSRLFREHPDWFVKDDDGLPLRSDRVTFGGWRFGPWYALDGTHPLAQAHLENLFRTMRQEWGINYFKLDACFWGAIFGGRRYDPGATRIQAYRLGLQAIRRGMGDAFMLLGNHPTWPSMGIAQAWRTSDDIHRSWDSFSRTGRQNLMRNWINGRLIWNDPDCLVLTGSQPENEFLFHAAVVYASGGSVLSGDDLPSIPPHRLPILRKLLPPTGAAAEFSDESLQTGVVRHPDRTIYCLFNWEDEPNRVSFDIEPSRVTDFWTGGDFGVRQGTVELELAGRSAIVLECVPVS